MFNDPQGLLGGIGERGKIGIVPISLPSVTIESMKGLTSGYSKIYLILAALLLPKLNSLEMFDVEHENGSYFYRLEKYRIQAIRTTSGTNY